MLIRTQPHVKLARDLTPEPTAAPEQQPAVRPHPGKEIKRSSAAAGGARALACLFIVPVEIERESTARRLRAFCVCRNAR